MYNVIFHTMGEPWLWMDHQGQARSFPSQAVAWDTFTGTFPHAHRNLVKIVEARQDGRTTHGTSSSS